jgi:ribose transport system permease protein
MTATQQQPTTVDPDRKESRLSARTVASRYGLIGVLLLEIAVFAWLKPDTFFTLTQFQSIALTQAVVAVLALAAVMPLVVGQFDVSIAFQLGLTQAVCAKLIIDHGVSWPVAALAAVGVGVLIGALNGFLVCVIRLNSFIATLGTGTFVLGLKGWYTDNLQITGELPQTFTDLTRNTIAEIPLTMVYVLVAMLVLWIAFEYTSWGREAHATGANPRAAHLAGVRVDRVTWTCFIGAGVLAAISGVVSVSILGASSPSVGLGELLPAYAAAFLGATAIRPGRFNSIGTVIAILVLAVGITGLQLFGAQPYVRDLFNGAALLTAITFAALTSRRARG